MLVFLSPMMSFQESFHKMDDMLRDPAYAKAAFFFGAHVLGHCRIAV